MIFLINYLRITPKIYRSLYPALLFVIATFMTLMMIDASLSDDAIPAEYLTIIYTKTGACVLVVLLFSSIICLAATTITSLLKRRIIIGYPSAFVFWVTSIFLITFYLYGTFVPDEIVNDVFAVLVATLILGIVSQTGANILKNLLWYKAFGYQNERGNRGFRQVYSLLKNADEREIHLSKDEIIQEVLKLDPSMSQYAMEISQSSIDVQNSMLTGRTIKVFRTVTLSSGGRFQSRISWDVYTTRDDYTSD